MQAGDTKDGFNVVTIPWTAPDMAGFDCAGITEYAADPSDIETFQRDGVVVLPGVFAGWVDTLLAGQARNIENPGSFRFPCESNPKGAPGRFFDSYCNWDLISEYRDYVTQSCAASMAGQFTRSTEIQFFHEHAFFKEPGTQSATPWHQDLSYYCVDGAQTVSVYVALDRADAEVAVRFVKGSHKWGKLYRPRVFMDGGEFNTEDSEMESVPDIAGNPDDYDILATSLEPGDTILFDFRTLHGTTDALLKSRRRAFSSRWLGDDVRYFLRPGETSPPLPEGVGVKEGEAMPVDWFPVLWRKR
jgi:ectoine hydroxylase-related dioxygenase (phytanoyl-CoA dioxygenase family)